MVLNIEWVQSIFQNCEILHPVRGLYDKNSASEYCFTSDVMYKKYKRLVYTPPDLLARYGKANLSNGKKFCLICFPRICFLGLIYSDQEPLWPFWVYIWRPSTRCKIWCTLRLLANYFSLKSLSLNPSKVTWMSSKVNWFVEYKFIVWFNYKFTNGNFAFSPG